MADPIRAKNREPFLVALTRLERLQREGTYGLYSGGPSVLELRPNLKLDPEAVVCLVPVAAVSIHQVEAAVPGGPRAQHVVVISYQFVSDFRRPVARLEAVDLGHRAQHDASSTDVLDLGQAPPLKPELRFDPGQPLEPLSHQRLVANEIRIAA